MPVYEYECKKCEHSFEINQSMEDKPKKKCPSCGKFQLYKIISEPIIIVRQAPTTLGQLAAKNSKTAGKTKVEELEEKQKKNKPKEPWYTKNAPASRREIQKMTREQKANYIKKGKK